MIQAVKFAVLGIVLSILGFDGFAQIIIPKERGSHVESVFEKNYFAVKLDPSAQSSAVTYFIYTLYYDSTVKYQVVTKHEFLSQFSGGIKSKANPDKKNLLNEHNINPMVFDYMWKVRYPEYPYGREIKPGWAGGKFIPTPTQMDMLKPFGVNHPADIIYGDSLISFLKAVSNPEWVNRYKVK